MFKLNNFPYLMCMLMLLPAPALADTTTGLIAWWKFDEGTGASAIDSSGNGNTGTLNSSPVWINGKRNMALQFSAGNNVTFGSITTSSTFTISGWINISGTNNSYNTIIAQDNTNGLWFQPGSGFTWEIGGTDHFSSASINNGIWAHFALVSDAGNTTWYINGTSAGTASGCSGFNLSTIATDGVGSDDLYGNIDDLRIYNRALTAQDVYTLYLGSNTIRGNATLKNVKFK